jgi:hypothetical protein
MMELKNAVAVCLISMFSATLVVLIARSLDNQAASRLEPQLAQIVEELHAIRTQGGGATALGNPPAAQALDDGLVVYYFHGDIRCPTCRAIESQTHETVQNDFAAQLESGKMAWKILNYEKPNSADLAKKFDVHMANVVLAEMDGGEIKNWKRLDQVWALVGDKPVFADFIRTEISEMLKESAPPTDPPEESNLLDRPVPDTPAPPLPQSDAPADLPLPE